MHPQVAGTSSEGAEQSFLHKTVLPLGLWTLVSLNVGAYFSQGDEGAQVLIHLDEFTQPLLDPTTPKKVLAERAERIARGSALNDSLKRALLSTPALPERLLEMLSGDANVSTTARNHAAKVLENICASPETQAEVVERGLHRPMIDLLRAPSTSLYVKKTLAAAICSVASLPTNAAALGSACALSALHDEQELSKALRRQRVQMTLGRLGASLAALPAEVLDELPARERELIAKYAEAEADASKQLLHSVRSTLVESGVLLYMHTAAGGAAWGLFESLRVGETRAALVQNVVRTSLVTCFVPIIMVGGLVSTYTNMNRATDSIDDKFQVYFVSSMALYPAGRLLQWVERFAPLWLGGHIVGFFSFFTWTLYTESDLLKTDKELLAKSKAD